MKYVKIEGGKKLSSFIAPMTAHLSDLPAFDSADWLFEIKWDGYRAIAEIGKRENRLYSRNGLTFDKAYSKVFTALELIKVEAVIDGEIVVFDETGKPNFQKLQNYKNTSKYPIQYYVFDCLNYKGKSIVNIPLIERKEILKKLIPESNVIRYCDHVEGDGKEFYRQIEKMGLEGMIAKKKNSSYQIAKRSSDWLKIKNIKSQEFIIVGYTEPKGSRAAFGSLLLAVKEGKKLVSVGNVGTGFTDKSLKEIHAKLSRIVRKTSPLTTPIKESESITWVEPVLVCNVKFTEITEDGSVRHPVFLGLRVDKSVGEIRIERGEH
jgi:bifunctional non-homologous end joining protein LigD